MCAANMHLVSAVFMNVELRLLDDWLEPQEVAGSEEARKRYAAQLEARCLWVHGLHCDACCCL